ncbi:MAG: SAM-dependent methyltransferase [Candidatus Arcticimaribacter sp.]|nr:class I SAM-dependent methyltransferase [Flavobacteriaceae bacterium]MDC1285100.1 class I SAM-dependent methyltransferase [Flavobacteriaceae bacterium]PSR09447.1 MAG: SAM-dependent methyltransferase [Candidatus Arcticimaribacter sp.]PTL98705.1 MAG: SAM-dependent methyltransferase [Candidatus Arcticimaribacter sp.]
MKAQTDIFGKALQTYFQNPKKQSLTTWTNLTDEDDVPLAYFFRLYDEMPALEKNALALASGKILDVGCGSGSHSLYLQNQRALDVTALDISEGAIEVAKARGVKQTHCLSIWDFDETNYDTILLLMNGMGIGKTTTELPVLLKHLKGLLAPEGSIFVDSSDLIYLFDEEDVALWKEDEIYYGEVDFGIRFEGHSEEFPWLYIDPKRLEVAAKSAGFNFKIITEGANYDFLAQLSL